MVMIQLAMLILGAAGAWMAITNRNKFDRQASVSESDTTPAIALPDDVPALIDLLEADFWQLRAASADALGDARAVEAIPNLIKCLSDHDSDVRESAADALSQIGPEAVPALLQSTEHRSQDVRIASVRALGQIGDPASLGTLIALLKDESAWVRTAVVQALGAMNSPDAVQSIIALLKEDDSSVRGAARHALQRIGTPEALDALDE